MTLLTLKPQLINSSRVNSVISPVTEKKKSLLMNNKSLLKKVEKSFSGLLSSEYRPGVKISRSNKKKIDLSKVLAGKKSPILIKNKKRLYNTSNNKLVKTFLNEEKTL